MEMIVLNKENNKKVRIKVRLTEEENEELKRCAEACGLSQSEFIRQLCQGKIPKPKPTKAVSYTHLDVYKRQRPIQNRYIDN